MRKSASNAIFANSARLSLIAAMGAVVAGCSSDFTRLGDSSEFTGATSNQQAILPGGNRPAAYPAQNQPYPGDVTGSVPPPAPAVQQSALPPVQQPYAAASAPAYQPPRVASAPQPVPTNSVAGSWVTLMPGETVTTLSTRYGVSTKAILQANNIADGNRVLPGHRILIPTFEAQQQLSQPAPAIAPVPKVAPVAQAPVPKGATPKLVPGPQPVAQKVATIAPPAPVAPVVAKGVPAAATPGVNIGPHVVKRGESLEAIASSYGTTKAKLMAVNGLKSDQVTAGQKLTLPSGVVLKVAKTAVPAAPVAPAVIPPTTIAAAKVAPAPAVVQAPAAPVVAAAPQVTGSVPAKAVVEDAAIAKEPAADAAAARTEKGPSFRWPVRGRVISEFGSKTGGDRNDGIGIAVPEGTSVKAAEEGEVIYSGNELKGYGNLVLVRHADGWVSAYAHASKLLVNKGDKVTRGQIIANAGATGSVTQPQLHFELRKGQKPMDPAQYLVN